MQRMETLRPHKYRFNALIVYIRGIKTEATEDLISFNHLLNYDPLGT